MVAAVWDLDKTGHERSNNIGVTTRIAVKSSEIEEIE